MFDANYFLYETLCVLSFFYAVVDSAGSQTQTNHDVSSNAITQTIKEFVDFGEIFVAGAPEESLKKLRANISPWNDKEKVDEFIKFSRDFFQEYISSNELSDIRSYYRNIFTLEIILTETNMEQPKPNAGNPIQRMLQARAYQKSLNLWCSRMKIVVEFAKVDLKSVNEDDKISGRNILDIAIQKADTIWRSLPAPEKVIDDDFESVIPPDVRLLAYYAASVTKRDTSTFMQSEETLIRWLDEYTPHIDELCKNAKLIAPMKGVPVHVLNLDLISTRVHLAHVFIGSLAFTRNMKSRFEKAKSGDTEIIAQLHEFVSVLRKVIGKPDEWGQLNFIIGQFEEYKKTAKKQGGVMEVFATLFLRLVQGYNVQETLEKCWNILNDIEAQAGVI